MIVATKRCFVTQGPFDVKQWWLSRAQSRPCRVTPVSRGLRVASASGVPAALGTFLQGGDHGPQAPVAVVQVSDVQYLGLEPVLYAQFKYLPVCGNVTTR